MGILFKKYIWVVYLLLIFIGCYFLAKITSTFIGASLRVPKKFHGEQVAAVPQDAVVRKSFDDYRVVMERNMFDAREIEEEVPEPTAAPLEANLEGPAVKTALPIKLISTVSVGDGTDRRSSATISSGRGSEETYTVEDEKQFSPGVKITKILPDRIEFINGRRLEFAEIESFGGGVSTSRPISAIERPTPDSRTPASSGGEGVQQVDEGKFVVDRAEIDNALGSLDRLFTQIRAVPQFKGGKASGLKLLSIRSGSLFAKLGLRRNDVLERINGQTVDMKKGMEIFNQLKDSDRISIDLIRNGQKTTLEYDIQ